MRCKTAGTEQNGYSKNACYAGKSTLSRCMPILKLARLQDLVIPEMRPQHAQPKRTPGELGSAKSLRRVSRRGDTESRRGDNDASAADLRRPRDVDFWDEEREDFVRAGDSERATDRGRFIPRSRATAGTA